MDQAGTAAHVAQPLDLSHLSPDELRRRAHDLDAEAREHKRTERRAREAARSSRQQLADLLAFCERAGITVSNA